MTALAVEGILIIISKTKKGIKTFFLVTKRSHKKIKVIKYQRNCTITSRVIAN